MDRLALVLFGPKQPLVSVDPDGEPAGIGGCLRSGRLYAWTRAGEGCGAPGVQFDKQRRRIARGLLLQRLHRSSRAA